MRAWVVCLPENKDQIGKERTVKPFAILECDKDVIAASLGGHKGMDGGEIVVQVLPALWGSKPQG